MTRVLVIDDQSDVRAMICMVLRLNHFDVHEAANAAAALTMFGEAAFEIAKDAYENSSDTIQSGTKAVARTVRDNPLGSLLIAGGIGFALALMMTRQARRPRPRWRATPPPRSVGPSPLP